MPMWVTRASGTILPGTTATDSNLLQGVIAHGQKEARDKMVMLLGTEMTSCSQGTKGHEVARTWMFIDQGKW